MQPNGQALEHKLVHPFINFIYHYFDFYIFLFVSISVAVQVDHRDFRSHVLRHDFVLDGEYEDFKALEQEHFVLVIVR